MTEVCDAKYCNIFALTHYSHQKSRSGTPLEGGVEYNGSNEAGTSAPYWRKHPWTFVHSFYAVMGGFVFETSTPIFGPNTRFVLTDHGIWFLMEHAPELLPDLSEASILNRSRSDGLGKALLIIQLLYFCISCAARWAQSLPLTLLEVATLARAVCAIATYLVWWKKPFDVAEPTVISGAQADEVAAYLLLITEMRRPVIAGALFFYCDSEYSYLGVSPAGVSNPGRSGEATVTVDGTVQALDVRPGQAIRIDNLTFVVSSKKPDSLLSNFIYGRNSIPWCHHERGPGDTIRHEERDLTRWRLAARANTRFPDHRPTYDTTFLTWRGGLQYSIFLSTGPTWWPCVPSVITALYGSCHLLGWNATFPTSVEHAMWRAGAVAMAILGLFASVAEQGVIYRFQYEVLDLFLKWFVLIIDVVVIAAYPVIGSFLVVVSLRQLFYLPDDAFQLPDFSLYLPHFA